MQSMHYIISEPECENKDHNLMKRILKQEIEEIDTSDQEEYPRLPVVR